MNENCWVCDYCIEKKKYEWEEQKEIVPKTVFLLVLEFVKRFQEKFWAQILVWILVWSKEAKIREWNLDLDKDYNILWVYDKDFVLALFDVLLEYGFLYKSQWQYPKIWISSE